MLLPAWLGLAGCSAIKLGYNNLDALAYWWIDGYVDLTDEQAPRVREDIARLHQWHRAHELPKIGAVLARLEQMLPGDIAPAQACTLVAPVRERLRASADRAEPAAVTLALDLGPEQLRHLERRYRKNNAQYRKEWLEPAPAELRDKRLQLLLERGEMVYGRLDEPQRAALRAQLEQSGYDAPRVLAERLRRQQDALQTLGKLAGQPVALAEARALVRGYVDRLEHSPDPAWRQYQEAQIQEGCRLFAALHNSTAPAQREAGVRRLRAYQRDLRELAARQ
ncbi:MAG TPA: DUF6279 family lipoprotein [Ramlibacter sp.]|nr:DUF6279 family lipoprotein [Ramlibacter sp.]